MEGSGRPKAAPYGQTEVPALPETQQEAVMVPPLWGPAGISPSAFYI